MTEKQIIELEKIEAVEARENVEVVKEETNKFNLLLSQFLPDLPFLRESDSSDFSKLVETLEPIRRANNPDYKQERSA